MPVGETGVVETQQVQDGGVQVVFQRNANRLKLARVGQPGETPVVQGGSVGNPLAVVVTDGKYKGVYGMDAFHVNRLFIGPRRLLAFLEQDSMPMQISLDISVEADSRKVSIGTSVSYAAIHQLGGKIGRASCRERV